MYLPDHFSIKEEALAHHLVDEHPFATLITLDESGDPFVNHLPLLLALGTGRPIKLIGHMAKKNPQWRHFASGAKATAVFHGPDAYITPTWYASGRDVPTWNYAVVHAQGTVKLIENFDGLVSILTMLTDKFENKNSRPWRFELPDDLAVPAALTSAIIGFEIHVEKIEAKFKLSQNRSAEDRVGVLQGLGERKDEMSQQLQTLMEELGI